MKEHRRKFLKAMGSSAASIVVANVSLAQESSMWIKGTGRVTVFNTGPAAITANFHAGDIGYVKKALGHYVENIGDTDLVYMEVFRADRFEEVSLSDWLAHSPIDMVAETLNLTVIAQFPKNRPDLVPA